MAASVDTLPTEILCVILLMVVESLGARAEVKEQLRALTDLGLVCHRWRDATLAEPQMWADSRVQFSKEMTAGREDVAKEGESLVFALKRFYSRSGDRPTLLSVHCELAGGDLTALNRFIISIPRWRKLCLGASDASPLVRVESWLVPLMENAAKQKLECGKGPFDNVQDFNLFIRRPLPYPSTSPLGLGFLQIDTLFPSLTRLRVECFTRALDGDQLKECLVSSKLVALDLGVASKGRILQDLLAQLPALQHLRVNGVAARTSPFETYTHNSLKTFDTFDGNVALSISSLELPSLETFKLGRINILRGLCGAIITSLTKMLSSSPRLRQLRLHDTPFQVNELYNFLISVPSLESLIMLVAHSKQSTQCDRIFTMLANRSKVQPTLPRLTEILVHSAVNPQVPQKAETLLRESFIEFVEDPRRWPPCSESNNTTGNEELATQQQENHGPVRLIERYLQIARLEAGVGEQNLVVYHRGQAFNGSLQYLL